MKYRNFAVFILMITLFSVSVIGCSKVSDVKVPETLSDAKNKMAEGNLDGANSDYLQVLSADPTNAEANFGAALLGVLGVAVDNNTRTLAAKFGAINTPATLNELFNSISANQASSAVMNYSAFIQTAITPEVTPSEIQSYIKATLIPALEKALDRLAVVEANPNFKFIVTTKMSGADKDREIDLGEIYSLDLLGSLMKAGLHELISYNWDFSTTNPLSEESFGTLKSDGAGNMTTAEDLYIRAMNKWIAGINYIDAETDDQTDDCIPKFDDPNLKNSVLTAIGLVKSSLTDGNTTFPITSSESIVVNLKNFYSSPVSDWKVYINGAKNNFPAGYDFTLNGLFPNMQTKDDWDNLMNLINSHTKDFGVGGGIFGVGINSSLNS